MERQKTNKNIGQLTDKVLVFGGVYGNLQALQKMHEIAKTHNIEPSNIICTGDIVGYCAQPEESVSLIRQWRIHSIAGNVEIQLREDQEDCGCDFTEGSRCDIFSNQWYPFAKKEISPESINWMKELPDFISFEFGEKKAFVLHGSFEKTSGYIFGSTPWNEKLKNFQDTESDIILAGHSGIPFSQKKENKLWLNAGVIGMPANDGTTRVWFAILDLDDKNEPAVSHQFLEYDFETASALMIENKLPGSYAKTLGSGIWDNCEILPDYETQIQGQKIVF